MKETPSASGDEHVLSEATMKVSNFHSEDIDALKVSLNSVLRKQDSSTITKKDIHKFSASLRLWIFLFFYIEIRPEMTFQGFRR